MKQHQREMCMKRGGGVVRNEASLPPRNSNDSAPRLEAADPGPTEEEIAVAVEEMTEDLADPMLRTIAIRRLQGYTNKEIADELGVTERTIIRKRQRIQAIWQHELVQ